MEIIELEKSMIVAESGEQAVKEFLNESVWLEQFDDNELEYMLGQ